MGDAIPTPWRARELLGALGVGGWAAFHLWEQWSAFAGRAAFASRMDHTSVGALALTVEIALGVGPLLAYLALDLATARRPEPAPLSAALADDAHLAARLGRLGRWGSRALVLFLLYHVAWAWAPKLAGAGPIEAYVRLQDGLSSWPHAALHAVGITALGVHVWQALPRLGVALGLDVRPDIVRGLRTSGIVLAVLIVALCVQLVGWHASGAGALWPLGTET